MKRVLRILCCALLACQLLYSFASAMEWAPGEWNFVQVGAFHSGIAYVYSSDGVRAHLNTDGAFVIPCHYSIMDSDGDFCEGFALLGSSFYDTRGNMTASFDSLYTMMLSEEYISSREPMPIFREGITIMEGEDGLVYVRANGEVVSPQPWEDAQWFSDGLGRVQQDEKYGYIDSYGKMAVSPVWDEASCAFSEGLAVAGDERGTFIIDRQGEIIARLEDQDVCVGGGWLDDAAFSEGFLPVERDGRSGFVDRTGQLVIDCAWDAAESFHEGLAVVMRDGLYGAINTEGELIIPCEWDYLSDFREGRTIAGRDGLYGILDAQGNQISPCIWSDLLWEDVGFQEGLCLVIDENGRYGFVDLSGELVIPCQFELPVTTIGHYAEYNFVDGFARVCEGDQEYFINRKGEMAIPFKCDSAAYGEGLFSLLRDNVFTVVSKDGTILAQTDLNNH